MGSRAVRVIANKSWSKGCKPHRRETVLEKEEALVWIDLEMSGLNVDIETILEIATIVTNSELEVIAEGPVFAIHAPEAILEQMDDWNREHHSASGLLGRVRSSGITLEQAQEETLAFLEEYTLPKKSPLCGNSIHQDRLFLRSYMPELESYFHYRNIDVSSIKELVKRWYPKDYHAPPKDGSHRALNDIRESIDELRFYRRNIFV